MHDAVRPIGVKMQARSRVQRVLVVRVQHLVPPVWQLNDKARAVGAQGGKADKRRRKRLHLGILLHLARR